MCEEFAIVIKILHIVARNGILVNGISIELKLWWPWEIDPVLFLLYFVYNYNLWRICVTYLPIDVVASFKTNTCMRLCAFKTVVNNRQKGPAINFMMTSSNRNIFRVTGPLWGNAPVNVNCPHKAQWRWLLMLSVIFIWTNGWPNHQDAGDLRRHRVHYNIVLMTIYNHIKHRYNKNV